MAKNKRIFLQSLIHTYFYKKNGFDSEHRSKEKPYHSRATKSHGGLPDGNSGISRIKVPEAARKIRVRQLEAMLNSLGGAMKNEEELQRRLEDGEESVIIETASFSQDVIEMWTSTPVAPAGKTPRRRRVEEGSEAQKAFLEIAQTQANALKMFAESSAANVEIASKQADALRMLAECSAASVQATESMAEVMSRMGEGLKACADALSNLTNAIYRV